MTYPIKTCKRHGAYTDDTCPRCGSTVVYSSLLAFATYQKLSPNKVSREEYDRYVYLKGLQDSGIIHALETQVSYDLLPKVDVSGVNWYRYAATKRTGFTQGALTYSPDFRYQYEGVTVIEEYKAVSKTKKGNLVPRIRTDARNKVKLWISQHSEQLIAGTLFFCISGWFKGHQQYYIFDSNSNLIDYPLANYIESELAA